MEHGVDSPMVRQVKTKSTRRNLCCHLEGASPKWRQLPRSCPQWKMAGAQPHHCANSDVFTRAPMSIGLVSHARLCSLQRLFDLQLNIRASRNKATNSWHLKCIGIYIKWQVWCKAKYNFKWHISNCILKTRVQSKFALT